MGVFDLLRFKEDEYKAKLKHTSDEELLLNEHRKRRQFVSSGASIGTGLASTAFVGPSGLVIYAYGARSLSVAEHKHKIILEELASRGIEPLEETTGDVLVPLAISLATAGIAPHLGPALHAGVQHLAPAGTNLAHAGLSTAHNAIVTHHVGESANAAMHGLVSGVKDASSQLVQDVVSSHASPQVTQGMCDFFSTHAATQCSVAANMIGHDVGQNVALCGVQEGLKTAVSATVGRVSNVKSRS